MPIFLFSLAATVNPRCVPVCLVTPSSALQFQPAAGGAVMAKQIGAIKSIAGNSVTLTASKLGHKKDLRGSRTDRSMTTFSWETGTSNESS